MTRLTSLLATLPLLTTSLSSASASHDSPLRRRAQHFGSPVSSPAEEQALEKRNTLSKRDFSGRATFYSVGLGACGGTNSDSDYVVALNQAQYQANNWCYKMITISYGGKSAQAQIVDECPGCPYGALDMSPGLFQHFADASAGVFYMSWSLNDGSGGGSSTTSSSSQWTPTTTWSQTSSTTSTWTPSSTSTWSSSSSASSSRSSAAASSGSLASNSTLSASSTSTAHGTAESTPAAVSGAQEGAGGTQNAVAYDVSGNLGGLNQVVIGLGTLVASGAGQIVGSSQ